ncbi:MAG TPA: hypothetical protein VJQ49_00655 [Casimicrobiaceae bacterium]|nr:hypothetical protein [Casimicrobiaceae bacterium]
MLLIALPCAGAETGTITLLFGQPKLLRGTAWFGLKEGVRVRDGDVLDLPQSAQLEIEFSDGGAVGIIGPGALYIAAASARDARQPGAVEMQLTRGWLKFATRPPAPRLRVRTGSATVAASDATAVVRVGSDGFDAFVETGTIRLSEAGKLPANAGGDLKGGSFVAKPSGKPVTVEHRPLPEFIAALPRDFMDPLPIRANRFATARVEPVADREATYAEAQSWLNGPYRASFIKRFQARIDDPAFRDAMAASGKAPPEWSAAAAPKTEAAPPAPASAPPPAKEPEPRKFRWPWEK